MPPLLFFLLLLLLPFSHTSDITLILQKIKPALQGPATYNPQLSTWNLSIPLCQWRGLKWAAATGEPIPCTTSTSFYNNITLSSDTTLQLLSIQLPASALTGHLPLELGSFAFLDSIFLSVNSLTGAVPLELGNSPSLSQLELSNNFLTGTLPPSIWNLCDRLDMLRLRGNNFSGELPEPAGPNSMCDQLRVLDLGVNHFAGEFPLFVTEFRGLEQLDLGGNRFSGPVPESLAEMKSLQRLNLSYNNFSGRLPLEFSTSKFGAEAFQGNDFTLCGAPLGKCGSGVGSGAVAGTVIGLMAGAVVLVSVLIWWAQGKRRRSRAAESEEVQITEESGEAGEGSKLMVFQGGEHLTLEDVLNATGQVMEKTSYGAVYKAKLVDGGNIELRLLREGSCKDSVECMQVTRLLGRCRHENLVPLRAFYQGRRGEKLLIYDYFLNKTLHDLLHDSGEGRQVLSWPRRHKIALGVARALAYLHAGNDTPITHGNVRSRTVLVDEFFVARLTEFGLDKLMLPVMADSIVAAAKADGYKAPELHSMRKCSPRTDVYAFGILLLELLMGKKPGRGDGHGNDLPSMVKVAVLEETTLEVFDEEVMKGVRSPTEEGLVQALKLAMGCCAPVASARPDMAEVVRQLEENRPKNRSAMYSPTETRSEIGTPY